MIIKSYAMRRWQAAYAYECGHLSGLILPIAGQPQFVFGSVVLLKERFKAHGVMRKTSAGVRIEYEAGGETTFWDPPESPLYVADDDSFRPAKALPVWAVRHAAYVAGVAASELKRIEEWRAHEAGVSGESIGNTEHRLALDSGGYPLEDHCAPAKTRFAKRWNLDYKLGMQWKDNPWCWLYGLKKFEWNAELYKKFRQRKVTI